MKGTQAQQNTDEIGIMTQSHEVTITVSTTYVLHVLQGAVNVGKVHAVCAVDLHLDEARRKNRTLSVHFKVGVVVIGGFGAARRMTSLCEAQTLGENCVLTTL